MRGKKNWLGSALTLVIMLVLSNAVLADWYFRGTPNNWGTTQMTQVAGSTTKWETTQDFTGNTSPRFKIDRLGNWAEAYPSADYAVATKKYKITFDSSTKGITVAEITAIPGVPTGVSAASAGANSIKVTWAASSGATSYDVSMATSSTGTYSSKYTGAATTATVAGLTTGVTYYFKVNASNAAGASVYSAAVSAVPTSSTDAWYFRGTPNSWGTTAMAQVTGTTKWETTQDFTGNASPRFKIDHKGDWTEAYPSTDYVVDVKKYKISFDSSTKAITVTIVGGDVIPPVPAGLSTSGITSNSLTLSWAASSGATSYTVYMATSAAGPYTSKGTATTTNFNVTGLSANTAYYFTVSATNSVGTSAQSTNVSATTSGNQPVSINGTMIQYFEWYLPNDGGFWNKVKTDAGYLANMGITALWLPPAYKGGSSADVGYGVYDLYDLGEFNQKGTIRTKYGTKDQYIAAIDEIHAKGMQVYADVVLNHKLNADGTETVNAKQVEGGNRNNAKTGYYDIDAWTVFNFPGRGNTYSSYKWNKDSFNGSDYDNRSKTNQIFLFNGKGWDWEVDTENGNYDYLMGADVDFDNTYVVNEMKYWGKWYADTAKLDGFRIDAVKHIKFSFFEEWLNSVRAATGKNMFAVGEYWNGDSGKLTNYIDKTHGAMSLFDVTLHYNFSSASNASGGYDMRYIYSGTLTEKNPAKSVTIVDNHDTQPGQMLQSPVKDWFKPLAYAMILLRQEGYPCVFYGDLYGAQGIASQQGTIEKLMNARKNYAYGTQNLYFDNADIVGWTRLGDASHPKAMAVVMSDAAGGTKYMSTGKVNVGFYDLTGNIAGKIYTDASGNANFRCNGGSVSVWVQE